MESPDAKEVAHVQANPEFAKAYRAIAKNQQGVWVGQDLSGAFAVRACLTVLPVAHISEWREGIWMRATDKSWKSLTEFPRRLRRMANEIEALNNNFFCISEACVNPTLVNLLKLPTILRSYAETLSRHETSITKAFRPPSQSRRFVEILNFAKLTTGKDRVKEVAELLNTAAIAMGYENKFDATHLTQARHRYRGPCAFMLPPK